jgi:hypothetical protein
MKTRTLVVLILGVLLLVPMAIAQKPATNSTQQPRAKASTTKQKAVAATATDMPERLAAWKRVEMPFHSEGQSKREIDLVSKLVEANHYIEDIFWRQNDPGGLKLFLSLQNAKTPQDQMVRRYLMIMGGRYDLLDKNRPFVAADPMPPGRGFYPPDLTRQEVEAYVAAHPDKKAEIYSPYTVVHREGSNLKGVPYHLEWNGFLQRAAQALREASELSDDKQFAEFLKMRADALLSDDYLQSDLAWMDLKDPKFDIIFAPYETYEDGLLGVKASYGGAVMIRNESESATLKLFEKYVADIQEALPLAGEDLPSKRGLQTPMEVMDTPFRAGDLRHGYQAVADNLPNDPRIHEQKGSKKIFFKNFMDARVQYVILPLSKRVMKPEQAAKASAQGYMASTILHEICHGLGPAFARVNDKKIDIREAIGPAYPGLEEAKADVVGMFGLKWLVDHGALPKENLEEYYASYVAGIFRTLRFGTAEAHGRAEMMEFNFLSEHKAITFDNNAKRYSVNFGRMPDALAVLAKELLEMEATGDRVRAENWFSKYNTMPRQLADILAKSTDVPVDIDPVFSFPEPIE